MSEHRAAWLSAKKLGSNHWVRKLLEVSGICTGMGSDACTRDRMRDSWLHGVSWDKKIILYTLSPDRGETGEHFL